MPKPKLTVMISSTLDRADIPAFVIDLVLYHELKKLGVDFLLAISACGSLREEIAPGDFVVIDQADASHARGGKIDRSRRSQSARADDQHGGRFQLQ